MDKWTARALRQAYEVKSWSKDPDKQVGALAVSPDKRMMITAYNGVPKVVDDNRLLDLTLTKEQKANLVIHAEINLIVNSQVDLTNWDLYVTTAPCVNCANVISQIDFNSIVCPEIDSNSSWSGSQTLGLYVLARTNIHTFYLSHFAIEEVLK